FFEGWSFARGWTPVHGLGVWLVALGGLWAVVVTPWFPLPFLRAAEGDQGWSHLRRAPRLTLPAWLDLVPLGALLLVGVVFTELALEGLFVLALLPVPPSIPTPLVAAGLAVVSGLMVAVVVLAHGAAWTGV